jgi:hypothetical protein
MANVKISPEKNEILLMQILLHFEKKETYIFKIPKISPTVTAQKI